MNELFGHGPCMGGPNMTVLQGPPGPPGPKGETFKFSDLTEAQLKSLIPNITAEARTYEPDEKVTVDVAGTKEAPKLIFGIPRGMRGEEGPRGEKGEQGEPMKFEDMTLEQLYTLIPDLHFNIEMIGANEAPYAKTSGTKARLEVTLGIPKTEVTTDKDFVEMFEAALNGE